MKKRNDDLVAAGGQRAGVGTQSNDDGAKEAATTKHKRKKSKKDAGAKNSDGATNSECVEVAGANSDATSDASTNSNASGRKRNHKKGRKKDRDSSPTPYVVANPDANKRSRKNSLLTALDAMSEMASNDGSDLTLKSASNSASVNGKAMQSIKAVTNMRDKEAMEITCLKSRTPKLLSQQTMLCL